MACEDKTGVANPTTVPSKSIAGWTRRQEHGWTCWSQGSITYIDTNADGKPDEEMDDHGGADNYDFKKDSNFDGVFDVAYHVGYSGIPERQRPIEERVPRVTD